MSAKLAYERAVWLNGVSRRGISVSDFQSWKIQGFCPICQKRTEFIARGEWLRDDLICVSCPRGSVPRERALALVLNELKPNWRELNIHESSPGKTGVSPVLKRDAPRYIATQYFPQRPFGSNHQGFRNENLESLTFEDESIDITVTLDVMEHVYHPDKVISEVFRTLKPGGIYICTFPVRKEQTNAWERRFVRHADGTIENIKEPEIHGNPVDKDGSIVTVDYGYDLHKAIAEWAPFDVRVYRFSDRTHGILGENTDLIVCTKPLSGLESTKILVSSNVRQFSEPLKKWPVIHKIAQRIYSHLRKIAV